MGTVQQSVDIQVDLGICGVFLQTAEPGCLADVGIRVLCNDQHHIQFIFHAAAVLFPKGQNIGDAVDQIQTTQCDAI